MTPLGAVDDAANLATAQAVLEPELLLGNTAGRVSHANSDNIVSGRLGVVPAFATKDRPCGHGAAPNPFRVGARSVAVARGRSAFVDHVGKVLGLCAEPEMTETRSSNAVDDVDTGLVVSDAGAVVAARTVVADFHPARNGASDHLPCKAMRGLLAVVVRDAAIAVRGYLPGPEPATIRTINPGPEALDIERAANPHAVPIARLTAESATRSSLPVRQRKQCSALWARSKARDTMMLHRDLPLAWNRGAAPACYQHVRGT